MQRLGFRVSANRVSGMGLMPVYPKGFGVEVSGIPFTPCGEESGHPVETFDLQDSASGHQKSFIHLSGDENFHKKYHRLNP